MRAMVFVSSHLNAMTGPLYLGVGLAEDTMIHTVEPCLADTPEMWPSTIMQTLCLVQNAISIDLNTNRSLKCRHLAKAHVSY